MTATLAEPATSPARPVRVPLRHLAWVTWRQHRTVLIAVTAVLSVCALIIAYYGERMHADFTRAGLVQCLPGQAHSARDCSARLADFQSDRNRVSQLMAVFLPLPVLFGLFVGAPLLAREFESGTYRFAFTQGAGRTRWLIVKISLLALFTLAATTAFTVLVMWWYAPLVPLDGRIGHTGISEIYGAVFVARALFALALGALFGALLRRVVPAIGATLLGWVAVVIVSTEFLRQHLISPLTVVNGSEPAVGWIISDVWRTPAGSALTDVQLSDLEYNTAAAGHKLDLFSYLAQRGYTHTVVYQPASRFWPLQWLEAGGLTVLSLALLAATLWTVRRRAA